MSVSIRKVITTSYKELTLVKNEKIQIQIEQDCQEAYIDLTKSEALKVAKAIIQFCES